MNNTLCSYSLISKWTIPVYKCSQVLLHHIQAIVSSSLSELPRMVKSSQEDHTQETANNALELCLCIHLDR